MILVTVENDFSSQFKKAISETIVKQFREERKDDGVCFLFANSSSCNVSRAVSHFFLRGWVDIFLEDVLSTYPGGLSSSFRENVYEKTREVLRGERDCLESQIYQELMGFFRESNHLYLKGFINFRLQWFKRDIEQTVDQAVEEINIENEYHDFINLLRYFVNMQKPRNNLLHVFLEREGFTLLDNEGQIIAQENIEREIKRVVEKEMESEGILISTLITLAPRKIVFHGFYNPQLIRALTRIFGMRIEFCVDCETCRSIKKPDYT